MANYLKMDGNTLLKKQMRESGRYKKPLKIRGKYCFFFDRGFIASIDETEQWTCLFVSFSPFALTTYLMIQSTCDLTSKTFRSKNDIAMQKF